VHKGKKRRSKEHTTGSRGKRRTRTRASASSAAAPSNGQSTQRARSKGNPRVAVSARITPELKSKVDAKLTASGMANVSELIEKAIEDYLQ
jgi:cystathionine beta-lyase/cystathionine gamma-synthase